MSLLLSLSVLLLLPPPLSLSIVSLLLPPQ
jgi:hypothetical protein